MRCVNSHNMQEWNYVLTTRQLRELVGIAAAALSGQIQDEDKEVVREELERLEVWQLFGTFLAKADGGRRNMPRP